MKRKKDDSRQLTLNLDSYNCELVKTAAMLMSEQGEQHIEELVQWCIRAGCRAFIEKGEIRLPFAFHLYGETRRQKEERVKRILPKRGEDHPKESDELKIKDKLHVAERLEERAAALRNQVTAEMLQVTIETGWSNFPKRN